MIHNDISRSFEYVTQPTEAGRKSREMLLEPKLMLIMIALGIILQTLATAFLRFQAQDYLDREQEKMRANMDAQSLQLNDFMSQFNNWTMAHPIALALITLLLNLMLIYAIGFVRSRQVEGFSLMPFYSAMSRITFVKSLVTAELAFFVGITFLISDQLGEGAYFVMTFLSVIIMGWTVFLYKGALEMPTIWGALGVTLLAWTAVVVIGSFASMIILVMIL